MINPNSHSRGADSAPSIVFRLTTTKLLKISFLIWYLNQFHVKKKDFAAAAAAAAASSFLYIIQKNILFRF